ncbi:MAG: YbhB/YbcL family Raf kinase inhibitor-like protein [Bryobacteraceae bacterium]
MRTTRIVTIVSILFIYVIGLAGAQNGTPQAKGKAPAHPSLTLTTTAFTDGSIIPSKYTALDPSPVSPELEWTNVPANTASFVLILHDPDVAVRRTTNDILHWLLFNIPGSSRGLPEGVPAISQLADGTIQGKRGNGAIGYLGMGAPAVGPYHHYTFDLYALDIKLDLGPDATREDVLKVIDGHILGKGMLIGRFHR